MKHIRPLVAAAMIVGGGVLSWSLLSTPELPESAPLPTSDSPEKRELAGLLYGKRLIGEYHDGQYRFIVFL